MKDQAIYIKANRNTLMNTKTVRISDVAKVYCKDAQVAREARDLVLLQIRGSKKENYVFSILKVIELIQDKLPGHLVCNVGEMDFIIEYSPRKKEHKVWEFIKVGIVCFVTFFGSAFTIMTFNEDASVTSVFENIKSAVLGASNTNSYLIELSYAIGLPIGCLVFFNHFTKMKLSQDPTPLQIQLRVNEQDINQTLVDNSDREGKSIDVD